MTNLITAPFAWIMRIFYSMTGSYGLSLLLFTLVVKLVMLPFQIKGKKSMVRMGRLSGKQKELEKKYANNKQKYQEEVQKLYMEEGINPMGDLLHAAGGGDRYRRPGFGNKCRLSGSLWFHRL